MRIGLALGAVLLVLVAAAPAAATPPRPAADARLQWQLGDLPADLSVDAEVYDLDLFGTTPAEIRRLHDDGRFVVCYVSAGTWEPYRPDADRFPRRLLGRRVNGFPDERWLDVRRLRVLLPILEDRLDRCAAKGFDGVELDNVDGWVNATGFPISRHDQYVFDRALADAATVRGLSPGLKNALGLAPALVGDFGWALAEQCVQYDECDRLQPFVDAGKAAFDVEYRGTLDELCPQVPAGVSASRKHLRLDAWARRCP